jgi:hypothetical protein
VNIDCTPPSTEAIASYATPHDVVVGLGRVQRCAAGHDTEAEHARAVVLGAEALPHDAGPPPPAGAVLGDLLEEVAVCVEVEGDLAGELVDGHASAADDLLAVGDAVHQGERHLLGGGGACVAEVGAGH